MTQQKLPIDEIKEMETKTDSELLDITVNTEDFLNDTFAVPPPPPKPEKEKKTRKQNTSTGSVTKEIPFTPPEQKPLFESDEKEFVVSPPSDSSKVTLDKLVSGKVLINSFDKIMSVIIPMGLNAFGDFKLKPSDIAATKEEKATLEPVVTECAKSLPIDFSNPWVALTVCVVAIYGSKAAEKVNFTDEMFEGEGKGTPDRVGSMRGQPKPHYKDKKAYAKWYRDNRN